jgi:hypothetical protein
LLDVDDLLGIDSIEPGKGAPVPSNYRLPESMTSWYSGTRLTPSNVLIC